MYCPDILARTLSVPCSGGGNGYAYGNSWQYHSRSDRHSKIACWGLTFDLLASCPLLRQHVAEGKVKVGINHEMRDFRNNKKKNLDLVLCRATTSGTTGGSKSGSKGATSFSQLAESYGIDLSPAESAALAALPTLEIASVSSVLLAIEAKAAMTSFLKARPRLKDELGSSFQTIHGDSESAIAAGLVLVNTARDFISPDRNKFALGGLIPTDVSVHQQPRNAVQVIEGLREIQRRSKVGDVGFDGLGVLLINCRNDGITPVTVSTTDPQILQASDDFEYGRFVQRLSQIYATRFAGI